MCYTFKDYQQKGCETMPLYSTSLTKAVESIMNGSPRIDDVGKIFSSTVWHNEAEMLETITKFSTHWFDNPEGAADICSELWNAGKICQYRFLNKDQNNLSLPFNGVTWYQSIEELVNDQFKNNHTAWLCEIAKTQDPNDAFRGIGPRRKAKNGERTQVKSMCVKALKAIR